MAGRFSLPGGVVEVGETLVEAAARELYEEVGVECEIVGFNRHVEPIVREGGRVRAHFVIASFVGRWTRGEARVSKEIDAVAWIEPDGSASLLTTPELPEVIAAAAAHRKRRPVTGRRAGGPRSAAAPRREQRPRPRPAARVPRLALGIVSDGDGDAPERGRAEGRAGCARAVRARVAASCPAASPTRRSFCRLAEMMGALAYLRDLCGAGDSAEFRARMAALLDAEAVDAQRRDQLAGAYNKSFQDYATSYRACGPAANAVIERYLDGDRAARGRSRQPLRG